MFAEVHWQQNGIVWAAVYINFTPASNLLPWQEGKIRFSF